VDPGVSRSASERSFDGKAAGAGRGIRRGPLGARGGRFVGDTLSFASSRFNRLDLLY